MKEVEPVEPVQTNIYQSNANRKRLKLDTFRRDVTAFAFVTYLTVFHAKPYHRFIEIQSQKTSYNE